MAGPAVLLRLLAVLLQQGRERAAGRVTWVARHGSRDMGRSPLCCTRAPHPGLQPSEGTFHGLCWASVGGLVVVCVVFGVWHACTVTSHGAARGHGVMHGRRRDAALGVEDDNPGCCGAPGFSDV